MPVLVQSLRVGWKGLLVWAFVLIAVMAMYLSFYPSLGGAASGMSDLIDELPEGLVRAIGYDQIATGAGYAQATFFGLLGFVLGTFRERRKRSTETASNAAGSQQNAGRSPEPAPRSS